MRYLSLIVKLITILYWNHVCGHSISYRITLERGVVLKRAGKVTISKNCTLSRGVIIDAAGGTITIGENTFIGPYSVIYGHGSCSIGRDCLLAAGAKIVPASHIHREKDLPINRQGLIKFSITIEDNCWFGFDVVLIGSAYVETGCIVRPKSVVSRRLNENSIYKGNDLIGRRHD